MIRRAPLLLAMVAAMPAFASTPAAWAASDKAAGTACLKAAGLKAASASLPLLLSDRVGTAILVSGTYPQAFMHGAKGTMLCIYDRRTGRAEASEAKGWSARR